MWNYSNRPNLSIAYYYIILCFDSIKFLLDVVIFMQKITVLCYNK